jgi:hypothetical protein
MKLSKYLKSVMSNFRDFKTFQLSNSGHTLALPPINHAITAMPMLDMMVILSKKTRQFLNPLWLECYLQMFYIKYIVQCNLLGIKSWKKELFGLVSKIGLQYWRRLYKSNYLNIEASNCLNTYDDGEEAADFGLIVERPDAFEGFIGSLVEALKNFGEIQLPVIVDCLVASSPDFGEGQGRGELEIEFLEIYYFGLISEFKLGVANAAAMVDTEFIRMVPGIIETIDTLDKYTKSLKVNFEPLQKIISPLLKSWIKVFDQESVSIIQNIINNEGWDERASFGEKSLIHTDAVVDFTQILYKYIDIFNSILKDPYLNQILREDIKNSVAGLIKKFVEWIPETLEKLDLEGRFYGNKDFKNLTKDNLLKKCFKAEIAPLNAKLFDSNIEIVNQIGLRVGNLRFLKNEFLGYRQTEWEWK